jgi:cardiolipin hydrolase
MALFRFSSEPLARAIRRARARNVHLRLVLDGHPEAEGNHNALGIAFAPGEVRRLDGKHGGAQGIMHHKFVLFDKSRVVTGSFNWTAGAEHINYENALLTDSSSVVTSFGQEFERLWGKAQNVDPGSLRDGGWDQKATKIRPYLSSVPAFIFHSFHGRKHHRHGKKFHWR